MLNKYPILSSFIEFLLRILLFSYSGDLLLSAARCCKSRKPTNFRSFYINLRAFCGRETNKIDALDTGLGLRGRALCRYSLRKLRILSCLSSFLNKNRENFKFSLKIFNFIIKMILLHIFLMLLPAFLNFCPTELATLQSFNNFLSKNSYSLVLFTSPSCKLSNSLQKPLKFHCETLKTRYEDTKSRFFAEIGLASLNIENFPSLQQVFNVSSTPKLLLFRENWPFRAISWEKLRENGFLQLLIREILADVAKIESFEEIVRVFERFPRNALLFIEKTDLRMNFLLDNLLKIKEIFKEVQLFRVNLQTNREFWREVCWENAGKLLLVRENAHFQEISLENASKFEEMTQFFEKFFYSGDVLYNFNEIIARKMLEDANLTVFLFFLEEKQEFLQEDLRELQEFNRKFKEIRVFFAEKAQKPMQKWTNFLGNQGNLFILSQKNKDFNILKYVFPKNSRISQENLRVFLENYQENRLQPVLRSNEPLRKLEETRENLVFFTGEQFFNEITNKTQRNKEFLVVFCQEKDEKFLKIKSFFTNFAEKLQHLRDFAIVLFDPERNDFIGKEIRVFPTLRLFPKKSEENCEEFKENVVTEELVDDFLQRNLRILKKND